MRLSIQYKMRGSLLAACAIAAGVAAFAVQAQERVI